MVEVDGQTIVFEPDEERNYRAVINYDDSGKNKPVDVALLKEITKAIENIVH
jgi:hypothetical protein